MVAEKASIVDGGCQQYEYTRSPQKDWVKLDLGNIIV
jgi:hypothetical protein